MTSLSHEAPEPLPLPLPCGRGNAPRIKLNAQLRLPHPPSLFVIIRNMSRNEATIGDQGFAFCAAANETFCRRHADIGRAKGPSISRLPDDRLLGRGLLREI